MFASTPFFKVSLLVTLFEEKRFHEWDGGVGCPEVMGLLLSHFCRRVLEEDQMSHFKS